MKAFVARLTSDTIGPNPTEKGKPGTKRHIVVDRGGLPLALTLTGANRHDSGHPDGSVKGGHVVRAVVWPTMEVFLTESAEPLPKVKDDESGLELFTFRP